MSNKQYYKDHSIYEGIRQFYTEDGKEVRIEQGGIWILEDNTWIFSGYVETRKKSLKQIWNTYKKNIEG